MSSDGSRRVDGKHFETAGVLLRLSAGESARTFVAIDRRNPSGLFCLVELPAADTLVKSKVRLEEVVAILDAGVEFRRMLRARPEYADQMGKAVLYEADGLHLKAVTDKCTHCGERWPCLTIRAARLAAMLTPGEGRKQRAGSGRTK